jgi:glucose uptake protein GlcU
MFTLQLLILVGILLNALQQVRDESLEDTTILRPGIVLSVLVSFIVFVLVAVTLSSCLLRA